MKVCRVPWRVRRQPRKADVRLPGKRNSDSHDARPVHLIITMIKWIRTSRLSIKDFLSPQATEAAGLLAGLEKVKLLREPEAAALAYGTFLLLYYSQASS